MHVSVETTRIVGNLPAVLDQLEEIGAEITRGSVSRKDVGQQYGQCRWPMFHDQNKLDASEAIV